MRLVVALVWRKFRHHFLSLDELASLEGEVTLREAERVAALGEMIRNA